jgi:hypothetical protein
VAWRAEFGHVRKQAIIRDLEDLGARAHWRDHVEIYAPGDGREAQPVMEV